MKRVLTFAASAVALAMVSTSASAAIVCNRDGDCWRTKKRYDYRPEFGLRIYSDNWSWKRRDRNRYRWRDANDGRGYYRNGVWLKF